MALRLQVARGSRPTGAILEGLLRTAMSANPTRTGVVCYGVPYTGTQASLNGNAGVLDKLEQGRTLSRAGVNVVGHLTPDEAIARMRSGVVAMLARKRNHVGGKDIMLALEEADIPMRVRAGAQFFSPYIPSSTEYRVWVYRRQHLGTYQKVLTHPERYRKVGRNFDNGFAFNLVRSQDVPRAAVDIASAAVTALNLDWGAVDVLAGRDGNFYVLEVNTAPGVESADRQVIQALAQKIIRWQEMNFPARNGTPEAANRRTERERTRAATPRNATSRIRRRVFGR